MFYWFLKFIALGPVLKLVFRPHADGVENVPTEGPAILASNHLSYADWLFMPLVVPRKVSFVAKAEYFTSPGIKGWLQKTFFSGTGNIPIDRAGADAAAGALLSAKRVLGQGELFGIYPEGTRSHDGRLYRGKTGIARLALETGVPVIPVAVVGTDVVAPPGKKFGRWTRPHVRFGKPLDFSRYAGLENDRFILRSITDEIMYEIMRLSGQEYVDMYATRAKEESKKSDSAKGDEQRKPAVGVLKAAVTGSGTSVRAVVAVENRMFRALAVLRVVVLVNAVGLIAYRNNYDHPVAGWCCVAVMIGWTAYAIVTYAKPTRRTVRLTVADLGIAVGLLVATPYVKGEWFNATIPGFWIMGALLAWAVRYGWRGGLVAAVVLGGTDRLIRSDFDQGNYGYVFLIVLGGPIVGYLVESLQQMAAERDLAEREAAAATERARLARVVHDGVLQVLALVQRRGSELGGEAAELGRLAGEQEQALRSLIRTQDRVTAADRSDGQDLAAALGELAPRPGVEVALPGGPVDLPAPVVAELVAVVGACLDNVDAPRR